MPTESELYREAGGVYVFGWGNNPKRATLKGRTCRLLAVGAKNCCLVEFTDDGQQEIVSRYALRRPPIQLTLA